MILLFNKTKSSSGTHLANKAKDFLVPKNNHVHILMITSFSKFANQSLDIDEKYTKQINPILEKIQNNGYTIVDIKVNAVGDQGFTSTSTKYQTAILYK